MSKLEFNHEYWMRYALHLARNARDEGEVPIGAVLVYNNQVIGEGWNSPISRCDPTAHAEIIALRQGGLLARNYRILNSTLYVTLIPCMMCSGAMVHSRISTLVYGADNKKCKKTNILINTLEYLSIHHKIKIIGGVLASTCSSLLSNFFRARRLQKKQTKKMLDI